MPTVRSNGCNIWYDTAGDGPPLVMVNGIGGSARRWWTQFPELLAAHYRLVLMDNRGTGFSCRPAAPWDMPTMADDVLAVADDLGLASFHLLGSSLGTVIVRHFAARHGARLRSLTLLCPPDGIPGDEDDVRTAIFWDRTAALVESARASWPILHTPEWAAANDARLEVDFLASLDEATPPETIQWQFEASVAGGNPDPPLNLYDWPVLIVHGTADRLVPPDNAIALQQAVPRARLEWLDGDGHGFWQHDPERAAAVVIEFLDSAEAGRKALV